MKSFALVCLIKNVCTYCIGQVCESARWQGGSGGMCVPGHSEYFFVGEAVVMASYATGHEDLFFGCLILYYFSFSLNDMFNYNVTASIGSRKFGTTIVFIP